jgi:phage-related protein
VDYVLLKITKREKAYIPQFSLISKPSSLYEKSFVELNILIHIKREFFSYILNKTLGLRGQGQQISQEDFKKIKKGVKDFRGNRYIIRVI